MQHRPFQLVILEYYFGTMLYLVSYIICKKTLVESKQREYM